MSQEWEAFPVKTITVNPCPEKGHLPSHVQKKKKKKKKKKTNMVSSSLRVPVVPKPHYSIVQYPISQDQSLPRASRPILPVSSC
jgi:hypothetical protein